MNAAAVNLDFPALVARLRELGYADDDIAWAEAISPPETPEDFALEIAFVICNSGMKNEVARRIFERVSIALGRGDPVRGAFGHPGKADAIERIWRNRADLLAIYRSIDDRWKLEWIGGLPWIGPVTKYHVAKNFGLQFAKPDVHLTRLARTLGTTVQALCESLARETGWRVATVDTLLWRAAAVGVLDTRTAAIRTPA